MSKTLILVDIGDRKLDDVKVSYYVEDRNTNKGILIEFDCPAIPLPQYLETPYLFRQEQIANGLQNEDGSVPVYTEDYMNGWNDCLDTLLGEDDE